MSTDPQNIAGPPLAFWHAGNVHLDKFAGPPQRHYLTLTKAEREARNDELARQRMFGATFRQIAKKSGLSKSQVHRLVRDVHIVCGSRRKPEKPTIRCELVPHDSGLGYVVRMVRV